MRTSAAWQRFARVGPLLALLISGRAVAFATPTQATPKVPEHFVVSWVGSGYEIHEILDGSHTDPVWLAPEVPLAHAWALVAGLRAHQSHQSQVTTPSEPDHLPGGHVAAFLIRLSSRSKLQPSRGLEYEVITQVAADGRSGSGVVVGLVAGVVDVRETIHFIE